MTPEIHVKKLDCFVNGLEFLSCVGKIELKPYQLDTQRQTACKWSKGFKVKDNSLESIKMQGNIFVKWGQELPNKDSKKQIIGKILMYFTTSVLRSSVQQRINFTDICR